MAQELEEREGRWKNFGRAHRASLEGGGIFPSRGQCPRSLSEGKEDSIILDEPTERLLREAEHWKAEGSVLGAGGKGRKMRNFLKSPPSVS